MPEVPVNVNEKKFKLSGTFYNIKKNQLNTGNVILIKIIKNEKCVQYAKFFFI